jgi:hypothetical protein
MPGAGMLRAHGPLSRLNSGVDRVSGGLKLPIIIFPGIEALVHGIEDDAARQFNPGMGTGHAHNMERSVHQP